MCLKCESASRRFNQEKVLVGAFSVIVKTGCGTDGSFYSTNYLLHIDNIPADLAEDGAGVQRLVGSPALRHKLRRQLLGFVSKKKIL